jgi:hypothetical protein
MDEFFELAWKNSFVVIAAAGNRNQNACHYEGYKSSSARRSSAIIVGAYVNHFQRAHYSNFGPCLGLFAPGQAKAASSRGKEAIAWFRGTSVSAGIVANMLIAHWSSSSNELRADNVLADFLLRSAFVHHNYVDDLECENENKNNADCLLTTRTALVSNLS